jgi:hypothetical protein
MKQTKKKDKKLQEKNKISSLVAISVFNPCCMEQARNYEFQVEEGQDNGR